MEKPNVKLIGQDGNAFVILGLCQQAARRAKWSPDEIKSFRDKAMAGDYDNLLRVVEDHFDIDGFPD